MLVVPSLIYANTYFIFCEHGTEVKVTTTNGIIQSNKPLTETEIQFIEQNILK